LLAQEEGGRGRRDSWECWRGFGERRPLGIDDELGAGYCERGHEVPKIPRLVDDDF
jgi:hypothetical protein